MADRRGTQALRTKVRQAERLLERNELPEKPFEHWELHLGLRAGTRSGDRGPSRRSGRTAWRLRARSDDLDLVPEERLAVTGRNGTGKSTLLGMLLGELPLEQGAREIGRTTAIGTIRQERDERGATQLLDVFVNPPASPPSTRAHCSPSSASAPSTSGPVVDAVTG